MANRSLRAAPHGVFPVQGGDCWIAIACETDAQWAALVSAMGSPGWATGSSYARLQGRLADEETIELRVAEWTALQDVPVLQERLLSAGVPAGVVLKALDLFDDPQLVHRDHFVPLEHSEMGVWKYDELGFKLADSPSRLRAAAPLLGQHTQTVVKDFLGCSDAEYQALVDSGALQ